METPNVLPPASIQIVAVCPVFSRMRWAWVSAVNDPKTAINTDKTTNGIFQVISTTPLF
jgi:hypothetical protein